MSEAIKALDVKMDYSTGGVRRALYRHYESSVRLNSGCDKHVTERKSLGVYYYYLINQLLLPLEGVNKTLIIWVELSSVMLRDHFLSVCIFLCKGSYSI